MAEQPTATSSSTTTTTREGGGGNSWLAFLVGGLLVVVAIIAWFMMSGGQVDKPTVQVPDNIDVNVKAPDVPAPSLPEAPSPAPQK